MTSDALLMDGAIVQIRPAGPADVVGVRGLHERVSPHSLYLRYFTAAPDIGRYVDRLLRPADDQHEVLVASLNGLVVGVAGYERLDDPSVAEVAFLVDDAHHGMGVGTLLLEHLAAEGLGRGVHSFVAETLPGNAPMLGVFHDAGYPVTSRFEDGVVEVSFPTTPDPRALHAAEQREAAADSVSIGHLLAPRSVTVVCAREDRRGLGHAVLANLVRDGYPGPVHAVGDANPFRELLSSVSVSPSLADVPGDLDLVVAAVPAEHLLEVAAEAAEREARSLLVIGIESTGSGGAGPASPGAERRQQLLDLCRESGMRLVGPGSTGVANTAEGVRLNATRARYLSGPGSVGLMSQSGALGIAALEYASRAGIGISTFVSAGDKVDVSGNDLLCYWENDPATRVCALYLQSFGNPRKFARIASRVSRTKPVVVVKAGRSVDRVREARSELVRAATPDVAVDALFAQAGVIRAASLAELFEVAHLLECSPLPLGDRVAVIASSNGAGLLAADACLAAGLQMVSADGAVPPAAGFDEGDPAGVRASLESALADSRADAVIVVYDPVDPDATISVATVITEVAGDAEKPVILVMLGVVDPPAPLLGADGNLMVAFHAFPEPAARALGAVSRYAAWLRRPEGTPPRLPAIDQASAHLLVAGWLAAEPAGGWLSAGQARELLSCFGIDSRADAEESADGVHVAVGVVDDPAFGPLVRFGLGGLASELIADHAFRILPLTREDAAEQVRSLRASELLFGYRGTPPVDVAALEDLLLRVAELADSSPEVAELDLNPVVVTERGVLVTDVKIRLEPRPRSLALLRRLSPR